MIENNRIINEKLEEKTENTRLNIVASRTLYIYIYIYIYMYI